MRCQLCFRLVESSAMKLRATCFHRVYVVKNMICSVANDYGFRHLRKILYVDKKVEFNFNYCSVLKKLEATQCFTTVIAKSPECKLISQDRLGTLM